MQAKKMPSGNWNVQVFSHFEEALDKNGEKIKKRKYRSFTAKTKAEALRMAAEFASDKERIERFNSLTVQECLQRFLSAKEHVLSPSTFVSYQVRYKQGLYDSLSNIEVNRLTSEDMQRFISDLSQKYSSKSVSNIYSILSAAIKMCTGRVFHVTFPSKKAIERHIPNDKDVKRLIENARKDMRLCIILASVGTLRRGEICGLMYKDVDYQDNTIFVHTDVVKIENKENPHKEKWIHKEMPKTSESIRKIIMPKEVIDLIGKGDPNEFIFKGTPGSITAYFIKLRNRLGLKCRFHDLRHYAASILHAIGVPDQYIIERGGWKTDHVMKSVYRNTLSDMSKKFSQKGNEYMVKALLDEGVQ